MRSTLSKSPTYSLIVIICSCFLLSCSSESEGENNGVLLDLGTQTDTALDVPSTETDTNVSMDMGIGDASNDLTINEDTGADAEPDNESSKLRIATWNIFYLDEVGDSPGGDSVVRAPEDYERLAGYVSALDADLIALQEMDGPEAARTLFPESIWDLECEDRDSGQNVCVVLRKSKNWKIERHPDLVSLRAGNALLRAGLDFTISKEGYPSVRMLAVHMKASCLFGDTAAACSTFFSQIDALEEWIDERAATEDPFLVLGDFNRFMTDDDTAWLEISDGEPARATLIKTVAADDTDCWYPTFVDHIILDNLTGAWLVDSAQQGYAEAQPGFTEEEFEMYYKIISDHCPLWADFDFPKNL